MRRRKQPEAENHERWLVSYADFITLLFAFFVVMFATGRTDAAKTQQFSDAAKEAFTDKSLSAAVQAILGRSPVNKGNAQRKSPDAAEKPAQLADLLPSLNQLSADLKTEIQAGKIQLRLEARGLVISMKEAAFFPSGTDLIPQNTYDSLSRVTAVIRKLPNPVRFEGHTDSIPIHNERFRSNWELSAARSIAMLEIFHTQFGVPLLQMAVSGYADTVPIASNETTEGRAENRRVDLLILSAKGMLGEPSPHAASAAK